MKKILLILICIMVSFSMLACGLILPDIGDDKDNATGGEFDTNHVTFLSAYAEAQELGFEGTLEEFIELISGKDGVDGEDGKDGKDGENGAPGKDGIGITTILLDNGGHLIVVLSDGSSVDCGKVTGNDGKDGADGKDGVDGAPGADGKDGADGITPTFKVDDGELYVSYDEGDTWTSLGYIQGADGKDGEDGKDGAAGKDGNDASCDCEKCDHSYIVYFVLESTCAYKKVLLSCEYCNDVISSDQQTDIPHNYKSEIVLPTCKEQGYTIYTCAACGYSYFDDYTDPTGHMESDWIIDKEPADFEDGSKHIECIICHKILMTSAIPFDQDAAWKAYYEYLDALAIYEEQLAAYNSYLTKVAAYQEKVDAYNAYLVALEEYNYYNNYKNLYPVLLDEYNLNVVAYIEYTAKMDKIRAQLAVFETGLFEHVTYLERDLYSCIMGDIVNSVLNREDEIVAGVPSAKGAIRDAASATRVLREIFGNYALLDSEAERYAFYISNYAAIKENVILLAQTLYDLYRYDIVRTGVHVGMEGSGGKTDKYVIMVSQLILFANAISDEPVYSYPDSKHAQILLDKNTTIEYLTGELMPYRKVTKTVLQILENNEYVKDTNTATPIDGGYPEYMEEPIEPIHPEDMPSVPKPTAVKKPGIAPTPVAEPIKPEEVPNPAEYYK